MLTSNEQQMNGLKKILIADDEKIIRDLFFQSLERKGFLVTTAADGREVVKIAQSAPYNLVITDIRMPGLDGIEVLRRIKEISPDTEVIIITGYASMKTAVEAVRYGAYDYIEKPFRSIDDLLHVIENAIERQQLVTKNRELLAELKRKNQDLETKREQELERFNRIGWALNAVLDREQILEVVMKTMKETIAFDVGTVLMLAETGADIRIFTEIPVSKVLKEEVKRRLIENVKELTGTIPDPKKVTLEIKTEGEGRWTPKVMLSGQLQSFLALPLVSRNKTMGLVGIGSLKRDIFSSSDLRPLSSFCNQAAIALDRVSLNDDFLKILRKLIALSEASKTLVSGHTLEDILQVIVDKITEIKDVGICAVRLLDEEKNELVLKVCHACGDGLKDLIKDRIRVGEGFAGKAAQKKRTLFIKDLKVETYYKSKEFAMRSGLSSLLCIPLLMKDRVLGTFDIYSVVPLFYSKREMELLTAMIDQAAVAIENFNLYQFVERGYFETIRALSLAIDAKDPYTYGHSDRLIKYGLGVAEEMNLSAESKNEIEYLCMLHDIGKIGIPGHILDKPGQLTQEEWSIVKRHPEIGETIIAPVRFLKEKMCPLVRHHHEHYDGKGYPDRLAGDAIPMPSRIIAVIDAYDAMTSDRPYRKALSCSEAINELRSNRGTQFDPRVVDAFLRWLERKEKNLSHE